MAAHLRACAKLDRSIRQESQARTIFDPLMRQQRAELRAECESALLADYRLSQVGTQALLAHLNRCVGCPCGARGACQRATPRAHAAAPRRPAAAPVECRCRLHVAMCCRRCVCFPHALRSACPHVPPTCRSTMWSGCCGSVSSTGPSRSSGVGQLEHRAALPCTRAPVALPGMTSKLSVPPLLPCLLAGAERMPAWPAGATQEADQAGGGGA